MADSVAISKYRSSLAWSVQCLITWLPQWLRSRHCVIAVLSLSAISLSISLLTILASLVSDHSTVVVWLFISVILTIKWLCVWLAGQCRMRSYYMWLSCSCTVFKPSAEKLLQLWPLKPLNWYSITDTFNAEENGYVFCGYSVMAMRESRENILFFSMSGLNDQCESKWPKCVSCGSQWLSVFSLCGWPVS